jgi:hypothetical protein
MTAAPGPKWWVRGGQRWQQLESSRGRIEGNRPVRTPPRDRQGEIRRLRLGPTTWATKPAVALSLLRVEARRCDNDAVGIEKQSLYLSQLSLPVSGAVADSSSIHITVRKNGSRLVSFRTFRIAAGRRTVGFPPLWPQPLPTEATPRCAI